MCELVFIWAIYTAVGALTAQGLPIWATSILIIATDRTVSGIMDHAKTRRDRLR